MGTSLGIRNTVTALSAILHERNEGVHLLSERLISEEKQLEAQTARISALHDKLVQVQKEVGSQPTSVSLKSWTQVTEEKEAALLQLEAEEKNLRMARERRENEERVERERRLDRQEDGVSRDNRSLRESGPDDRKKSRKKKGVSGAHMKTSRRRKSELGSLYLGGA